MSNWMSSWYTLPYRRRWCHIRLEFHWRKREERNELGLAEVICSSFLDGKRWPSSKEPATRRPISSMKSIEFVKIGRRELMSIKGVPCVVWWRNRSVNCKRSKRPSSTRVTFVDAGLFIGWLHPYSRFYSILISTPLPSYFQPSSPFCSAIFIQSNSS